MTDTFDDLIGRQLPLDDDRGERKQCAQNSRRGIWPIRECGRYFTVQLLRPHGARLQATKTIDDRLQARTVYVTDLGKIEELIRLEPKLSWHG